MLRKQIERSPYRWSSDEYEKVEHNEAVADIRNRTSSSTTENLNCFKTSTSLGDKGYPLESYISLIDSTFTYNPEEIHMRIIRVIDSTAACNNIKDVGKDIIRRDILILKLEGNRETSYLKRNEKVLELLDTGEITRSMTSNEDNMIAKDNENYDFWNLRLWRVQDMKKY